MKFALCLTAPTQLQLAPLNVQGCKPTPPSHSNVQQLVQHMPTGCFLSDLTCNSQAKSHSARKTQTLLQPERASTILLTENMALLSLSIQGTSLLSKRFHCMFLCPFPFYPSCPQANLFSLSAKDFPSQYKPASNTTALFCHLQTKS